MTPFYLKQNFELGKSFGSLIKSNIYRKLSDMSVKYVEASANNIDNYEKYKDATMEKIQLNTKWANAVFENALFCFEGDVPKNKNIKNLFALVDVGGEGLVLSNSGEAIIGLTTEKTEYDLKGGYPAKIEVPLLQVVTDDDKVKFYVDASSNDLFGNFKSGKLLKAEIVEKSFEVEALYYDYLVLCDLATNVCEDKAHKNAILKALGDVYNMCSYVITDDVAKKARDILAKELKRDNGNYPPLKITALGNAHLDLAWLWRICETRRKNARTISTVFSHLEKYKDYKFCYSQPQLMHWLKCDYPKLYDKLKCYVENKKIELACPMWVEPDVNISSGESLIRQIFYGKKFLREEFGVEPNIMWLPDVFGFPACLPQILKKSGIDCFLTIKLKWNKQNVFPHHTFVWRGIDGSDVLCHMPPLGFYNLSPMPKNVGKLEEVFTEKGIVGNALMLYGIGDGGGGPIDEHHEILMREKNLLGLSPIEQGFAEKFFADLKEIKNELQVHFGELYLERHQGVFTSNHEIKRLNFELENALKRMEFVCLLANDKGYNLPIEKIDELWREVLLYQFHDILPGTCISAVYSDCIPRMELLLEDINLIANDAIQTFSKARDVGEKCVINTCGNKVKGVFKNDSGDWKYVDVEPFSSAVVQELDILRVSAFEDETSYTLKNEHVTARISKHGEIVSFCKNDDTINMLAKSSNVFNVYNDLGDCWDMALDHRKNFAGNFKCLKSELMIDGASATVICEMGFNKSKLTQKIMLKQDSKILEFDVECDWQEEQKFLKVDYSFKNYANEYIHGMQFGMQKRPIDKTTTEEFAKFEVPFHKYIGVCDSENGVFLLSKHKYGASVSRGKSNKEVDISLSLLRSAGFPNFDRDHGMCKFSYAIMQFEPKKQLFEAIEIAEIYANEPLIFSENIAFNQPVMFNADSVLATSIKLSWDKKACVIRLVEACGHKQTCEIMFLDAYNKFFETDLMEKVNTELFAKNRKISIDFKPFEIKTLRFEK